MFCPDCGIEDAHTNPFCRACGADLRRVRNAISVADSVTESAASARNEIGRAMAAKILEAQGSGELKEIAEDVLPQIEKFLESPEEKRLRRVRIGSIIASAGFGTAIALSLVALVQKDSEMLFLAGLGIVAFFVGLGFVINGFLLTVPRKALKDRSSEARSQRELDGSAGNTNELPPGEPSTLFSSVTENTTRHLQEPKIERS